MTALPATPDRAARIVALLVAALTQYRPTVNRARKVTLTLDLDGDKIKLPVFDDLPATETADVDETEQEILEALGAADGPLTVEQLEAAVGCDRSAFYRPARLKRLVSRGLIRKLPRGGYELVEG